MRIISFELFRRNCVHLEIDYNANKRMCKHFDNDNVARYTVPNTNYSYAYTPCMEKFCPVLGLCKKVKPKRGVAIDSINSIISVPLYLAERLRDNLAELLAERSWWKDESRRTYQKDYNQMAKDLSQIEEIIKKANDRAELPGK